MTANPKPPTLLERLERKAEENQRLYSSVINPPTLKETYLRGEIRGRTDFIENELRALLEMAKYYGEDREDSDLQEYTIDEIIEKAKTDLA